MRASLDVRIAVILAVLSLEENEEHERARYKSGGLSLLPGWHFGI